MKRALITGGSGAIGAAVAEALARDGVEVLIQAHHHRDAADALSSQLNANGGKAHVLGFDLTQIESCDTTLSPWLEEKAIDILVHAAGIHDDAPLVGMSPTQWHRVVDVSLHGFYNVTHPLLMPMIRQRYGRIVSLASVAGVIGNRGQANYAAAKAGLIGASKSLSQELASRNVLVNVVAPGVIESPMSEGHFDHETVERLVPMKRAGKASEVADLIAFLVSDKASYITGQVIGINGGMI